MAPKLGAWQGVRTRGGLDASNIRFAASSSSHVVEYRCPGGTPDAYQGTAVFSAGANPQETASGVWLEGCHIAASDIDNQRYVENLPPHAGKPGIQLMHFCSKSPCDAAALKRRAKVKSADGAIHVNQFRVLTRAEASTLPYATVGMRVFAEAMSGAEGGAPGTPTDAEGAEEAAIAALQFPPEPPRDPLGRPGQGLSDRGTGLGGAIRASDPAAGGLDPGLAARLNAADGQARADLRAARPDSGTPVQGLGAAVPRIGQRGVLPPPARPGHGQQSDFLHDFPPIRPGGPGAAVSDQLPPDFGGVSGDLPAGFRALGDVGGCRQGGPTPGAALDADHARALIPHGAPSMEPAPGPAPSLSPGAQMQDALAQAAQKMAVKRKAEAPGLGATSSKRRLIQGLAYALGGDGGSMSSPLPGGASADDELWSGDPPETSIVPYDASLASTAVLAEKKPGELLQASISRIRGQLAAIHGEEAVKNGSRLLTFYHEIIFRPTVGANARYGVEREMKTLAVAIDSLLEGGLARTGDLLVARYKALEESVKSGHWDVASELEAVPSRESGLASEEEIIRATAQQARKARLQSALQSLRRSSGVPAGGAPPAGGRG